MPVRAKPVDLITITDLQALVDNKVLEKKHIEYKQSLPSRRDEESKEFLRDVSSFASASGGDLILGISQQDGEPHEICGLKVNNLDEERLRLENLMRDGIEPRIPGTAIHSITDQGKTIIIIRVPRSWALPHVVKYKGHWRFYSRNSGGVYPIDVQELRAAFLLSESVAERIRKFRIERLSAIVAGEIPVEMVISPKVIVHVVPLSASAPGTFADLSLSSELRELLVPIYADRHSSSYRFILEGILAFSPADQIRTKNGYLKLFRNGIIEAVDAYLLPPREERTVLPAYNLEETLIEDISRFLQIEQKIGMSPPWILMVSLSGVHGYRINFDPDGFGDRSKYAIDRDLVLIPELLIEAPEAEIPQTLRPIFDALWNAGGWERCMNYGLNGNRIKRP